MATLDAFVKAQQIAHRRAPSDASPDPARCLRVQRVAPSSVAEAAGIGRGDLVVLINGRPAGTVGEFYWATDENQRRYTIHSPSRRERIDLTATGIELGMTVRPTAKAIAQNYRGNPADLSILWEEDDWKTLIELASRTLLPRQDDDEDPRNHPALALLGAGLYEIGATREGLMLLDEYERSYAPSWTQEYAGLVPYYQARELVVRNQREDAVRAIAAAWAMNESDKVADLAAMLTGSRPKPAVLFAGRNFPVGYRLQQFETGQGLVALGDALRAMPPGKLLIICLLASYRSNGPYNAFMGKFIHAMRWFGDFVHGLHVITMNSERPDRAHWFENEDRARRARLPFSLLFDGDAAVTQAVGPTGSPFIMMLDREGVVRYEGWFDLIDLWETIANPV